LIAIDAQAFARIGGFDERFFLYREETDLCDRMRQGGWTVRHVAGVTATHDGDASSRDHRPIEIRPASVRSHYIYLQKHRGRWIAGLAWLLGVFGSISWLVIGPRRRWAKESIRAHMQALPLRMRGRLS